MKINTLSQAEQNDEHFRASLKYHHGLHDVYTETWSQLLSIFVVFFLLFDFILFYVHKAQITMNVNSSFLTVLLDVMFYWKYALFFCSFLCVCECALLTKRTFRFHRLFWTHRGSEAPLTLTHFPKLEAHIKYPLAISYILLLYSG